MSSSTEVPPFKVPRKPSQRSQWLNLDAIAVLVFVAIGRDTHDGGVDMAGLIETAAPFMIALVVGWFATKAWKRPTDIKTGLIVWPTTVMLGMVLRRLAFDRGTAAAFIVVATMFLFITLVGWRVMHHLVNRSIKRTNSKATT